MDELLENAPVKGSRMLTRKILVLKDQQTSLRPYSEKAGENHAVGCGLCENATESFGREGEGRECAKASGRGGSEGRHKPSISVNIKEEDLR